MTKKYNIFILIIIFYFSLYLFAKEKDLGMETIKSFYEEYTKEYAKEKYSAKKLKAIRKKYISKSLLKHIETLDLNYDIFVSYNESGSVLIDSFRVIKGKDNTYTVVCLYPNDKTLTILLTAEKENGVYKISGILKNI